MVSEPSTGEDAASLRVKSRAEAITLKISVVSLELVASNQKEKTRHLIFRQEISQEEAVPARAGNSIGKPALGLTHGGQALWCVLPSARGTGRWWPLRLFSLQPEVE
jgi:hypothetical protein